VKSPVDLYDVAGTASLAWFAPRLLVVELGGRYNVSQPGDVQSHRVHGVAILTPSSRRSVSARVAGGSEGWQLVTAGTTLRRFHSTEAALAWREKLTASIAVSVQADHYRNPFYTRSGITLGASRYW
jgi:YaiO family outer membrane protein